MVNVLFVCLGNICRSPLAEGVFQTLIDQEGLGGQINAESCGTGNYHIGEKPHPLSRRVAQSNGIELRSRARQFVPSDFEDFDYILAMDASNKRNLGTFNGFELAKEKVFLIREFDDALSGKDLRDTYGGDFGDFEECYRLLKECCNNLLTFVKKEHPELS